jgi:hypothetical protein
MINQVSHESPIDADFHRQRWITTEYWPAPASAISKLTSIY